MTSFERGATLRGLAALLLLVMANPLAAQKPEIRGRVVCGYQGWFTAQGDGAELGFRHYGLRGRFRPGQCSIDMWPDMSEYGADERFDTDFRHQDGTTAQVFSSVHPATVRRHFSWMKEYGLGAAMAQRFLVSTRRQSLRTACDRVLRNVREAGREHEMPWALMYDLSGSSADEIVAGIRSDLTHLLDQGDFREDPHYLHHEGRPLIAIWGVGFSDGRKYRLSECAQLMHMLREDGELGGWSIFLGVPYWWRSLRRDALDDDLLHEIIAVADIVSPWSVGRYATPEQARKTLAEQLPADIAWLTERQRAYCPVIFPGFSWHNLKRGENARLDQIPRLGGRFFEAQSKAVLASEVDMVYIAMFDEIDEATAIFKVSSDPPVGASPFLTYEDRPSDHYLRLAGQLQRRLAERLGAD